MKYMAEGSTKFRWDIDTSISIIGNHTLVLESKKGTAVLLLEDELLDDREVLIRTLESLPENQYHIATLGKLTIELHRTFLMLSLGEVVTFIDKENGDLDTLLGILGGPTP